jgi:peptidoglycan hydrolase-like protein with peptidoglycan-binding domain
VAAAVLVVLLGVAAAAVALIVSKPSLTTDSTALGKVGLPLGGGTIESVSVVTGPHSRPIQVNLKGHQLWPQGQVAAGSKVSIDVVIKRPGWVSWLTGKTEHLTLTLTTPTANVRHRYLTLKHGAPLRVGFTQPVATVFYGSSATDLKTRLLNATQRRVTLPKSADAGSLWVAAVPRPWETAKPQLVSWFPSGSGASAVAYPSPGATIKPNTPITLTFSKPVSKALGKTLPPVSPATAGSWHTVNDHSIVFRPEGYGYGLGAHVAIGLPNGVHVVGGKTAWTVPGGSPLRLQQLLAVLGYLPLRFHYTGPGPGTSAVNQEEAAIKPPAGSFSWRYPNTPAALRNMWAPGTFGQMTKGAIMAFENANGMTADGIPGPAVWKALITAAAEGHNNTFGYTFVQVNEGSPETQSTWHSGKTVVSGPVNTGIPAAPTAKGTFAVFEHAPSVTMSGTNPDGSHYNDPGVPWVSYFNGGDALHGFLRASYGSAQSLGCVEMPYSEAHDVYQYTPIGTLVNVS